MGPAPKSDANAIRRGVDFATAALVFEGEVTRRADRRRDYGEERMVAVGVARGILLTVVYTDRVEGDGDVVRRIISARRSNRRERKNFARAAPPGG